MTPLALAIVIGLESFTFFMGGLLHTGIAPAIEPRIFPATVVEGLCGLFLAISVYAVLTRKKWAWEMSVAGQSVSLLGVLLGMIALAFHRGPSTPLNFIYHHVIFVVLIGVLILLFTSAGKAAFKG